MHNENILRHIRPYTLIDDNRLTTIYNCIQDTWNIPGSMAEVGSFKGGSAFFIAYTNPNKFLYVCDSFEGLDAPTNEDAKENGTFGHKKGDFSKTTKSAVETLLMPFNNNVVLEGFFPNPDIHKVMYDQTYSFVHLDVDLYKATLDCLEFFYPRMNKGGIIVCDDYKWQATPGVEKAISEFLSDKPEKLIDNGFKSCFFVKE